MKILIFLGFMAFNAWSKPLVMISYFDPFNGSQFNNSERIAIELAATFKSEDSPLEVKLCALNTIFDKAYAQLEDCLKSLSVQPVMVISLGEATCELKIETMMRNNDKTHGPDNAGNERSNTTIIPGAPEALGMHYPLPQMFCGLTKEERKNLEISNSAGSFVCNNTGYQMSYYYPQLTYGFIHVPASNCSHLIKRSELALAQLKTMIPKGVTYLLDTKFDESLPHASNEIRLPVKRDELRQLRDKYQDNECLSEYLKRSRSENSKSLFSLGVMN